MTAKGNYAVSMSDLNHFYLEDSYFLGWVCDQTRIRLRILFVLTIDHPLYEPPKKGEAHCYREGDVTIESPRIANLSWTTPKAIPTLIRDPDGSFDMGDLELFCQGDTWTLITEWFEMQFQAQSVSILLDGETV